MYAWYILIYIHLYLYLFIHHFSPIFMCAWYLSIPTYSYLHLFIHHCSPILMYAWYIYTHLYPPIVTCTCLFTIARLYFRMPDIYTHLYLAVPVYSPLLTYTYVCLEVYTYLYPPILSCTCLSLCMARNVVVVFRAYSIYQYKPTVFSKVVWVRILESREDPEKIWLLPLP